MSKVLIRDYTPSDLNAVIALVRDSFVGESMPDAGPRTAESMAVIFARESLAESTRARVAEVDGKVVGLAFANVHGHRPLPGRLPHWLAMGGHVARVIATGLRDFSLISEQLKVIASYKTLRQAIGVPITDELKLFAVDANTRGLGMGGKLFDDFTNHLAAHGRTRFHLYTDTDCTWGFYDARGMTRVAETTLRLRTRDGERALGVFLYSGDARTVRRSRGHAVAA